MKYSVVVNPYCGNREKLDVKALARTLGNDCEIHSIDDTTTATNDVVVVCGGDGTLKNALDNYPDKQIYFVPCGTLNETKRLGNRIDFVGNCNGTRFAYVCATGSFTEIGYSAKCTDKQRSKALAYLLEVFKWYICHNITTQINLDGKDVSGTYTLLMVLKSSTCFGLSFNKMYDKKPQTYMLGIRACGKNNLINKVKMFFPFFRVFFGGVRRPTVNKRWFMLPFDNATVKLEQPQNFCVDGELRTFDGTLHFSSVKLTHPVKVLSLS